MFFHSSLLLLVLPPVLVPRQSEYPRPPPPLPSPFRSVDDPPMPYNASFPFNRQNQLDHSPNSFDMPGDEIRLFISTLSPSDKPYLNLFFYSDNFKRSIFLLSIFLKETAFFRGCLVLHVLWSRIDLYYTKVKSKHMVSVKGDIRGYKG